MTLVLIGMGTYSSSGSSSHSCNSKAISHPHPQGSWWEWYELLSSLYHFTGASVTSSFWPRGDLPSRQVQRIFLPPNHASLRPNYQARSSSFAAPFPSVV